MSLLLDDAKKYHGVSSFLSYNVAFYGEKYLKSGAIEGRLEEPSVLLSVKHIIYKCDQTYNVQ